jgi:SAM-dependent methyltransferase
VHDNLFESAESLSARRPSGEQNPCALCGGRSFARLFHKQGYDFTRCTDCSLVRLDPLPTPELLAEVYERSYREGLYAMFAKADDVRIATARARVAAIAPHVPAGPWLDVGCSTGAFLQAVVERGIEAEGFDLSATAVEAARARGLQATQSAVDDFTPLVRYACITAFDLVEHLIDPNPFLARVRDWLAPGGRLAITVPDIRSAQARVMGRHWYYYAPPVHVNYFDRDTIVRLLARHGLATVHVGGAPKVMTIDYVLQSLAAFNPLLHRGASVLGHVTPAALRRRPLRIPVGELLVLASA